MTKYVRLYRGPQATDDSDGWLEALTPPDAWVAITPQGLGGDDRTLSHSIVMRWHPQITMDAVLVYADGRLGRDRTFLVRSLINVDERNEVLQLVCDEVVP